MSDHADTIRNHYTKVCTCVWDGDDDWPTRVELTTDCVIHGSAPDPLETLLAELADAKHGRELARLETESERAQSHHLRAALDDAAVVIERMANGASRAECSPELDRVREALKGDT